MSKAVILLDIDGVINIDSIRGWEPDSYVDTEITFTFRERKLHLPFMYSTDLIKELQGIHNAGIAEVKWATTWIQDESYKEVEKALNFGPFEASFTLEPDDDWRDIETAKRQAARSHVRAGFRTVWIDDEVIPSGFGVEGFVEGRDFFLVRPNDAYGIQPDDIEAIRDFLNQ